MFILYLPKSFLEYNAYPNLANKNASILLNSKNISKQNSFAYFIRKINPPNGYWYSAAYIDYLDAETSSNCSINLNVSFNNNKQNNVTILTTNRKKFTNKNSLINYYKYFYSEFEKPSLSFKIIISTSLTKINCSLIAFIQESQIPDANEFSNQNFNWINDSNSSCKINLDNPAKNKWYYLMVKSDPGHAFSIIAKTEDDTQSRSHFKNIFKAFRQIKDQKTTFLFNTITSFKTNELAIESDFPSVIEFHTNENNLGNILNIKINIPVVQHFPRIEHSLLNENTTDLDVFSKSETILIHVCLLEKLSKNLIKNCSKTGQILAFKSITRRNKSYALFMNSSNTEKSIFSTIFPRIGPWYLTFEKECFDFNGQAIKCESMNVIHTGFISIESNQFVIFNCNKNKCTFNESDKAQHYECAGGK